ncbi:MAG: YccF domain-containing protein [Clostridia bacterium]|nr:YccF domain-containing protein [Clostridia bacterium]
MKTIGNILWFLFGGLISGLSWWIAGLLWCVTIVGIPIGRQCFKFAKMSFSPFGKEIRYRGGVVSTLVNMVWIIFSGLPMALENALFGLLWCITIVGIPFGKQFFKLAQLSLMPFGAEIVSAKKAEEG